MFKDLAETCVNAKEAADGDEFRAGIAEAGRQSLQTGSRARGAVERYRDKAERALGRSDMSDPAGLASDVATGFIPSPTAGASGPLGFGAGALAGSHIQRNLQGSVAKRMAGAFAPGDKGLAPGAKDILFEKLRERLPGLNDAQKTQMIDQIGGKDMGGAAGAARATRGAGGIAKALRALGLEGAQIRNFLTGRESGHAKYIDPQSVVQGQWAKALGKTYETPGVPRALGKALEDTGMSMPDAKGKARGPRGILGGVLGMIPSIALNISQNRAMRERGGASAQSALRRMTSSLGEAQFEPEKRRIALDLVKNFGPSKAVQALMQMTAGGSKTDPAESLRLILRARGADETAIDRIVARTAKRSMVGTHFTKAAFPGALNAANVEPQYQSAVEDWNDLTGTTMPDVQRPEDEGDYDQMAQYYNTIMDKVRSNTPALPGLAKDIGGAGIMGAGGAALASRVPGWFGKAGPSFGRALPLAMAAGSLPALYKHLRGKTRFTGGPEDSDTEHGLGLGLGGVATGAAVGGAAGHFGGKALQERESRGAAQKLREAATKDFPRGRASMGADAMKRGLQSALEGEATGGLRSKLPSWLGGKTPAGAVPREALNAVLKPLGISAEQVLTQMRETGKTDAAAAIDAIVRKTRGLGHSGAQRTADTFRRGGFAAREGDILSRAGKSMLDPATVAESAKKLPGGGAKSELVRNALASLTKSLRGNRYSGALMPALGALGLGGAGIAYANR